jgi:AcrR family transcriptional regulator
MKEQPRSVRPRGRPSDESIDGALTEAALEEFTERGYHAMSMESIAARAGVSKVSLYRRWNSKSAIVAEVFRHLSEMTPPRDQGSLKADIRALLDEYVGSSSAAATGQVLMRTMGEISGDPELLALYRTQLLAPRYEQLRVLVQRARARKELRAGLPIDVACAMIAGPLFLYYLALLAGTELNVSGNLSEQLTRAILGGILA